MLEIIYTTEANYWWANHTHLPAHLDKNMFCGLRGGLCTLHCGQILDNSTLNILNKKKIGTVLILSIIYNIWREFFSRNTDLISIKTEKWKY